MVWLKMCNLILQMNTDTRLGCAAPHGVSVNRCGSVDEVQRAALELSLVNDTPNGDREHFYSSKTITNAPELGRPAR